jgi:hypothetical protein
MRKVLIMGGHPPMAEKVKALKFDHLTSRNFKIESAHSISDYFDKHNIPFKVALDRLMNNAKLNFRAQILVTFMMGKNYRKSYSFKTRIRIIFFSPYKIIDFYTFKIVMRQLFRFKTFLHLVVFVFGALHFSRTLFLYILRIGVKEVKIFENLLEFKKPDMLFLLDNGNNAIFFLLNIIKKKKNIKYVFIVYSWDNTTTKCFIPKIFDYVGAWNQEQISEIHLMSGFEKENIFVLGSSLADKSYANYNNSLRSSKLTTDKRRLLFIGMFNKSEEVNYLKKIKNFLDHNETPYNSLTYRPHPQSRSSEKKAWKFDLESFGVIIDKSENFSVLEFDAVICLPTSMLLEVIVSRLPLILFLPKDRKYRADPYDFFSWTHYKSLRTLNFIPRAENEFELLTQLQKEHLPLIDSIPIQFQNIFPNYGSPFEARLKEFIESMIGKSR